METFRNGRKIQFRISTFLMAAGGGRRCCCLARLLLLLHLGGGFFPFVFSAADTTTAETHLRYQIEEEVPRGTHVGDLIEDAGLRGRYRSDVLQLIRFRFLADSVELFDVGSVSGIIRTTEVVDRDSPSLCRQRELCELNLDVVVQPSQYFQIIKVKVEILDVNDNSPKFREGQIYLSIIEAAQVGSVYILPTALDADSPAFGIQRYELESHSNRFGLQSTAKIDGVLDVRLVLREKLDRETESEYRLKLTAYDGGPTPRTGSSIIVVTVLDSNDNKPQFTNQQYEVSVLENLPVGTVILQVHASDADAGLNGKVEYGLTGQSMTLLGQKFGIRNATGEIYVRGNIDHEQAAIYQLVVFARDHGPEPFTSEATVVVHVDDLNDNAPEVTISTLAVSSASYSAVIAEVWENATVGTFVAHVSVIDRDAGANGRVNCTLNENAFSLLRKYATEYQIVTNAPLDRERTEQYAVTLKCQDGATVSRVTEKTLRVIVGDVNDNSPVFSQPTYKGSLIENNYIGASIMQVTASDWDDGDNARLQYSIPGNLASLFYVDQRGVISAHSSIDREKYDGFRFPILAADMGTPTRTGSALVVITIEDVNDEKPRFNQPSYIFSVLENEPPGTVVGTVQAEDKDGPQYNSFAYAFLTEETANGPRTFLLNPSTGLLTTQRPLDRETKGMYKFVVVAYDLKATSMSGSATVSVNVLDRNDNAPEFLFPRRSNDTVYISNLLPVGHVVTEVSTRDADLDANSKLSFRFVEDPDGAFRIDPERGTILVSSRLSDIDYRTFRLTISATDHGTPPRSQSAELKIHVNRTIPFGASGHAKKTILSTFSLILVTVLVSGLIVVIIITLTAVVLVRQRERRKRIRKQNSRMEALRMLTTKDNNVPTVSLSSSSSSSSSSPKKRSRTVVCNGGNAEMMMMTTTTASVAATTTATTTGRNAMPNSPPLTSSDTEDSSRNHQDRNWNSSLNSHEEAQESNNARKSFDFDKISDHPSIESSVTDSGRGGSEEGGEAIGGGSSACQPKQTNRERFLPPPPPPPRGSYWLQQQQQQQQGATTRGAHGHTTHSHHPSIRFSELSTTPEEEGETPPSSSPSRPAAHRRDYCSGGQLRRGSPARAGSMGEAAATPCAESRLLMSSNDGHPTSDPRGSFISEESSDRPEEEIEDSFSSTGHHHHQPEADRFGGKTTSGGRGTAMHLPKHQQNGNAHAINKCTPSKTDAVNKTKEVMV